MRNKAEKEDEKKDEEESEEGRKGSSHWLRPQNTAKSKIIKKLTTILSQQSISSFHKSNYPDLP